MTDPANRCHWNGTTRVTRQHLRDCNTSGCDGCQPCTLEHCTMPRCSRHLGDHETGVCHRCIGDVRTSIKRLVTLCAWAPTVAHASASIHTPAVDLAAPVANPTDHAYRRRWIMGGGLCRCAPGACPDQQPPIQGPLCGDWHDCEHPSCKRRAGRPSCPDLVAWLDNADDEQHPLWVLGTWDRIVGTHLGHERTMRVTIGAAAGYLTANLTHLARTDDFPFDELARDITDCVAHVETVLAIAPHTQKGAPCPVCHAAGRKAKPLERMYDPLATRDEKGDPDESQDQWVCPRPECGQAWKLGEYDKYIERESLEHADRLTLNDMSRRTRLAAGTLRRWAATQRRTVHGRTVEQPPLIRPCGRTPGGTKLYRVDDVLKIRDTTEPATSSEQSS